MKQSIPVLLVASLVVLVGCTSAKSLDTQSMVGMPFRECVKKHDLDKHKNWSTPNLPPGSDGEITYFLPDGNLMLHLDAKDRITFATFDRSDKSAEERQKQVYAGWHEWVEAHTIKKTQPDAAVDADKQRH